MKRVLLVPALCATLAAPAAALDIRKGATQLSGSTGVGFTSSSYEADGGAQLEQTSFAVAAEGYYYFWPMIGLGIYGSLRSDDYEINNGDSVDVTEYLLAPAVRYNLTLGEKANLFLGASLGYANAKVEDDERDGYYGSAQAGVAVFPVCNISADIALRYLYGKISGSQDDYDLNRADITIGLSVYF